jgi:type IV pilus assembly protein PilW
MTHFEPATLFRPSNRVRGYSLVELMVALVLGLMILAGLIALFKSNRQVSATSQSLGDVQDATRTAFTMLARDIRLAGNTPCGAPPVSTVQLISNKQVDPSNVLTISGDPSLWWLNWNSPIQGYDGTTAAPFAAFGTGAGQRTTGTDALSLVGTDPNTAQPILGSDPVTAKMMAIPSGDTTFVAGDPVVACSPVQGSVFLVTSTQSSFSTGGVSGKGISFAAGCTAGGLCTCSSYMGGDSTVGCANAVNGGDAGQNIYTYKQGSTIALLAPTAWYIGSNSAGGSSLWRVVYGRDSTGTMVAQPQEIVRGATALTLAYQTGTAGGGWVAPDAVSHWGAVVAVQATLTVSSGDTVRSGLGTTKLARTFTSVTTIRNKAP